MTDSSEAWVRFGDGKPIDLDSLCFFADSILLSGVDIKTVSPTGFGTYEMTIFFRQEPKEGWLRGRLTTRMASDGVFDVDAEMYDSEGNLVAQAKQLAVCQRSSKL